MSTRAVVAAGIGAVAAACAGAWALWRRFGPDTYLRFKTMFGIAKVYQVQDDCGRPVRLLSVGGIVQSGTYLDDEHCYDLVFEYLKRYDALFDSAIPVRRVLVMGCGGYDYPEHLVAHHPEVTVDAVEIDPAITAIAQRYFFLDRLVEEFDTEATGRLNLVTADARAYLDAAPQRYDAIVNDTFDAGEPAPGLVGEDAARAVRACLNPGGAYLTNIVSAVEGPGSAFLHQQVACLSRVFDHVEVVPCDPDSLTDDDNVVVICR